MPEPNPLEPTESPSERERDERGRLTSYGARQQALRRHAADRARQSAEPVPSDPQGAKAANGLVEPSGGHDSDTDLSIRALRSIRDSRAKGTLNSDRIRAAEAIARIERERAAVQDGGGCVELLAWERVLAAEPDPHVRRQLLVRAMEGHAPPTPAT